MKLLSLLSLIALFLCGAAFARPWILLFGTNGCEECAKIKSYWQEEYVREDDPVLVFIDADQPANYEFLDKVETALDIQERSSSFPVLFVGKKLVKGLEGFDDIEEKIPELVKDTPSDPLFAGISAAVDKADGKPIITWRAPSAAKPAAAPSVTAGSTPPAAARAPRLLFFETQGCRKCARQNREFTRLREQLPAVDIAAYDVTTLDGQAMLARTRQAFGLTDETANLAPLVCWAEGYVTGRLATADELRKALAAPLSGREFWLEPLTDDERREVENHLENVISTLTWWSVISGGLLDGINPCAFATSVFLISYLLYLKRRRREILLVGACFCLGVFLTYFLYGLALSQLLRTLLQWPWVKTVLYGGFGLCGLVLCALHLRDAIRFRRTGRASDMDMGLSKETHRGIHEKIRRYTALHSWLLGPAAILLGAVVSSMELACTGQVYFPILTALSALGMSRFVLLLLLYNVLFIIPLAVITVLAAYGVGAKALGDWAKNHVFATKVLMATLFALLGALMIVMAFDR